MDLMIPRIEIDSGRRQTIVRYTLTKKLKPLVEHRMSMFERVFPISERLAQKMLTIGYKQKSRFGQWCPVKVVHFLSAIDFLFWLLNWLTLHC